MHVQVIKNYKIAFYCGKFLHDYASYDIRWKMEGNTGTDIEPQDSRPPHKFIIKFMWLLMIVFCVRRYVIQFTCVRSLQGFYIRQIKRQIEVESPSHVHVFYKGERELMDLTSTCGICYMCV